MISRPQRELPFTSLGKGLPKEAAARPTIWPQYSEPQGSMSMTLPRSSISQGPSIAAADLPAARARADINANVATSSTARVTHIEAARQAAARVRALPSCPARGVDCDHFLRTIKRMVSSSCCGRIPSSRKPGMSGDATVSTCMSSI